MNAIELKNITKSFRDFVLDDLNLIIPEGSICGLVGENGAGKSTTIKLLMGAARPDSGSARVLGIDSQSAAFRDAKENIGVVMDEAYFPEVLNAVQVGKVMRGTYLNWDDEKYKDYIKRFDLPEKKQFKAYSRGMRMKLAIATAMSHHAKLLILDEATAGLDPIIRDEILEELRDFARQDDHSILISSHILSDLEKLCDSIAFLHKGKLLFHEEKDILLDQYGIFHGTSEEAAKLPIESIAGQEKSEYGGVRALILREKAENIKTLERPNIEEIILFMVRGAKKREKINK